jgi:hypothetical protein
MSVTTIAHHRVVARAIVAGALAAAALLAIGAPAPRAGLLGSARRIRRAAQRDAGAA